MAESRLNGSSGTAWVAVFSSFQFVDYLQTCSAVSSKATLLFTLTALTENARVQDFGCKKDSARSILCYIHVWTIIANDSLSLFSTSLWQSKIMQDTIRSAWSVAVGDFPHIAKSASNLTCNQCSCEKISELVATVHSPSIFPIVNKQWQFICGIQTVPWQRICKPLIIINL